MGRPRCTTPRRPKLHRTSARLRERGQAPGAIVVVHRLNVGSPAAIYRELKRRGIAMQLNPLVQSGLAAAGDEELGITADQYGDCGSYKQYFEHMLRRLHADLTRARRHLAAPAAAATPTSPR